MSHVTRTTRWAAFSCVLLVSLSALAAGVRGAGDETAVLLSPLDAKGSGGGSVPVVVEEGESSVADFRRALRALPQKPVGTPVWRFDVVRGRSLVESVSLSETESQQLGLPARIPSAFLYRAELAPDALGHLDGIFSTLSGAGFRAFHPGEERAYWSSYEITRSAYDVKEPRTDAAPASSRAGAAVSQIQARLRTLIPSPLAPREEELFQKLNAQFVRDYEAIAAEPGIRSLQVDYARQRWLNAADRRNLLVTATYFVRTPAELQVIERYYERAGGTQGRSQRPQSLPLQVVTTDPDLARVRARLGELLPELRSVRPGH
jgi:hypothetical protein